MIQHITVSADTMVNLKPLIEGALRSEARLLELGIERTLERLRVFEKQYGLASEEFERRFEAGSVDDELDLVEWAGEIRTYRLLAAQRRALQEARLS